MRAGVRAGRREVLTPVTPGTPISFERLPIRPIANHFQEVNVWWCQLRLQHQNRSVDNDFKENNRAVMSTARLFAQEHRRTCELPIHTVLRSFNLGDHHQLLAAFPDGNCNA